jgi:hypothetical protein
MPVSGKTEAGTMPAASARDALRPGDVLAVRTSGLAAELIRVGEELSGKPGLENHIAVFHHWDGQVPWGLEGKPGGVGWADLRAYLGSVYTINNCLQPDRDDAGRAQVAAEAERMLGTAYDWQAIADDTLRAFHMADLFASTWHGIVPGMTVCSSFAAFLYGRQGWERPQVPGRDTEPGDWCAFITEHRWSATISVLRQVTEGSGATPW